MFASRLMTEWLGCVKRRWPASCGSSELILPEANRASNDPFDPGIGAFSGASEFPLSRRRPGFARQENDFAAQDLRWRSRGWCCLLAHYSFDKIQ